MNTRLGAFTGASPVHRAMIFIFSFDFNVFAVHHIIVAERPSEWRNDRGQNAVAAASARLLIIYPRQRW